jgi:hypothetical protein
MYSNPVLLLLMQVDVAQTQWIQTSPPCCGQIISFDVAGTNIFAGTCAAVFGDDRLPILLMEHKASSNCA